MATVAQAVTPAAAGHLRSLREERGLDGEPRVRIVRRDGKLGMSFLEEPRKSDKLVEVGGMQVYLARNLTAALGDGVIDLRVADGRARLVLRRTNGQS